ncbi:MAG: hypothetical protein JNK74_20490 [Candidatus Hydrogenedentes bacterium]|nr:hypothetical protein [Candidatus Hydrogenedentota bacterium]
MPPEILFREDQQFRQPILWIVLLGVSAFCIGTIAWMISRQVLQGIPFGEDAMSNDQMVALGATIVLLNAFVLWLLHAMKLQTEVTEAGLFVRFKPIHRKTRKIDLTGVTSVASVKYRPAMEYGGWGIRRGRRGMAYNVSGDLGVRIDYENGYHLLIGTRYPEELKAAVDQCMAAR